MLSADADWSASAEFTSGAGVPRASLPTSASVTIHIVRKRSRQNTRGLCQQDGDDTGEKDAVEGAGAPD